MARQRWATSDAISADNMNRGLDTTRTNLLRNSDFESFSQGATQAPDQWKGTANDGTIERSSSAGTFRSGSYGLHLAQTSGGSGDTRIEFFAWPRYAAGFQGRAVTASVWAKCAAASTAKLRIEDGVATSTATHTGGGGWERLVANMTVAATATKLTIVLEIAKPGAGSTEAWFDQAQLVLGDSEGEWSEAPEDRGLDAIDFDDDESLEVYRAPRRLCGLRTAIDVAGGAATENLTITLARGFSTPLFADVQLRGNTSIADWVRVVAVAQDELTIKVGTFDGSNLDAGTISVYFEVVGVGHQDPEDQF
jgi:hypothetical protein